MNRVNLLLASCTGVQVLLATSFSVCILLLGARSYGSSMDETLRKRFIEGIAGEEEAMNRTSGRCKYLEGMYTGPTAAALRRTREVSIDYVFHGSISAKEIVEKDGITRVSVRNPRYAFVVTKEPKATSYSLQWLAQYGDDPVETDQIEHKAAQGNALALGAFQMYGRFVWDLVREPGFELTGISSVDTDEGELVRVEFNHYPAESETSAIRKLRLENAYLLCVPSDHWRLCEYGRVVGRGGDRTVVDCLASGEGMLPIVRKVVSTRKSSAGEELGYKREITCMESAFDDVREEEFYLSHYGLPEPTFRRSWIGMWAWYLIMGVACLAVSAMILKRRRATA